MNKVDDKIELLRKFDMTNNEAEVYLALANQGTLGVAEIREKVSVPRNKIYEALDSLEKKNRIASISYKPKKFKIVNSEFLKEETKQINDFALDLIETIENSNKEDGFKFFEIIKSKDAIIKKLRLQNMKTEKDIIGANKFSDKLYNNVKSFKQGVDRGIRTRIITTFQENRIDIYKMNLDAGVQIRVYDEKKFGAFLPRITVFDKKIARFTIGEPEIKNYEDYVTIWTESSVLANAFYVYLENLWKDCEPIEEYLEKYKKK